MIQATERRHCSITEDGICTLFHSDTWAILRRGDKTIQEGAWGAFKNYPALFKALGLTLNVVGLSDRNLTKVKETTSK